MALTAILRKGDGAFKGVLVGLDKNNIAQLQKGRPYHHNLREFGGPDVDVLIMFGNELSDIVEELREAGIDAPVEEIPKGTRQ